MSGTATTVEESEPPGPSHGETRSFLDSVTVEFLEDEIGDSSKTSQKRPSIKPTADPAASTNSSQEAQQKFEEIIKKEEVLKFFKELATNKHIKCPNGECGLSYDRLQTFLTHYTVCVGKSPPKCSIQCKVCGVFVINTQAMYFHMQRVHCNSSTTTLAGNEGQSTTEAHPVDDGRTTLEKAATNEFPVELTNQNKTPPTKQRVPSTDKPELEPQRVTRASRVVRMPSRFKDFTTSGDLSVFHQETNIGSRSPEEHDQKQQGRGRPRGRGRGKGTPPPRAVTTRLRGPVPATEWKISIDPVTEELKQEEISIPEPGLMFTSITKYKHKGIRRLDEVGDSGSMEVSTVSNVGENVDLIDDYIKEEFEASLDGNEDDYLRYQEEMLALAASENELHGMPPGEWVNTPLENTWNPATNNQEISSIATENQTVKYVQEIEMTVPVNKSNIGIIVPTRSLYSHTQNVSGNTFQAGTSSPALVVQPSRNIQEMCKRTLANVQDIGKKTPENIQTVGKRVPIYMQNNNSSSNSREFIMAAEANTQQIELKVISQTPLTDSRITMNYGLRQPIILGHSTKRRGSNRIYTTKQSRGITKASKPQNYPASVSKTIAEIKQQLKSNDGQTADETSFAENVEEDESSPRKKNYNTEEMLLKIADDLMFDEDDEPPPTEVQTDQILLVTSCDNSNLQTLGSGMLRDSRESGSRKFGVTQTKVSVSEPYYESGSSTKPIAPEIVNFEVSDDEEIAISAEKSTSSDYPYQRSEFASTTVAGEKAVRICTSNSVAFTYKLFKSKTKAADVGALKTVVIYPREPANSWKNKKIVTEKKSYVPRGRGTRGRSRGGRGRGYKTPTVSVAVVPQNPESTITENITEHIQPEQVAANISGQFEPINYDVTSDETPMTTTRVLEAPAALHPLDPQFGAPSTVITPVTHFQSQNPNVEEFIAKSSSYVTSGEHILPLAPEYFRELQENKVIIFEQELIPVFTLETNSTGGISKSQTNLQHVLMVSPMKQHSQINETPPFSDVEGATHLEANMSNPDSMKQAENQYQMSSLSQDVYSTELQYMTKASGSDTTQFVPSGTQNVVFGQGSTHLEATEIPSVPNETIEVNQPGYVYYEQTLDESYKLTPDVSSESVLPHGQIFGEITSQRSYISDFEEPPPLQKPASVASDPQPGPNTSHPIKELETQLHDQSPSQDLDVSSLEEKLSEFSGQVTQTNQQPELEISREPSELQLMQEQSNILTPEKLPGLLLTPHQQSSAQFLEHGASSSPQQVLASLGNSGASTAPQMLESKQQPTATKCSVQQQNISIVTHSIPVKRLQPNSPNPSTLPRNSVPSPRRLPNPDALMNAAPPAPSRRRHDSTTSQNDINATLTSSVDVLTVNPNSGIKTCLENPKKSLFPESNLTQSKTTKESSDSSAINTPTTSAPSTSQQVPNLLSNHSAPIVGNAISNGMGMLDDHLDSVTAEASVKSVPTGIIEAPQELTTTLGNEVKPEPSETMTKNSDGDGLAPLLTPDESSKVLLSSLNKSQQHSESILETSDKEEIHNTATGVAVEVGPCKIVEADSAMATNLCTPASSSITSSPVHKSKYVNLTSKYASVSKRLESAAKALAAHKLNISKPGSSISDPGVVMTDASLFDPNARSPSKSYSKPEKNPVQNPATFAVKQAKTLEEEDRGIAVTSSAVQSIESIDKTPKPDEVKISPNEAEVTSNPVPKKRVRFSDTIEIEVEKQQPSLSPASLAKTILKKSVNSEVFEPIPEMTNKAKRIPNKKNIESSKAMAARAELWNSDDGESLFFSPERAKYTYTPLKRDSMMDEDLDIPDFDLSDAETYEEDKINESEDNTQKSSNQQIVEKNYDQVNDLYEKGQSKMVKDICSASVNRNQPKSGVKCLQVRQNVIESRNDSIELGEAGRSDDDDQSNKRKFKSKNSCSLHSEKAMTPSQDSPPCKRTRKQLQNVKTAAIIETDVCTCPSYVGDVIKSDDDVIKADDSPVICVKKNRGRPPKRKRNFPVSPKHSGSPPPVIKCSPISTQRRNSLEDSANINPINGNDNNSVKTNKSVLEDEQKPGKRAKCVDIEDRGTKTRDCVDKSNIAENSACKDGENISLVGCETPVGRNQKSTDAIINQPDPSSSVCNTPGSVPKRKRGRPCKSGASQKSEILESPLSSNCGSVSEPSSPVGKRGSYRRSDSSKLSVNTDDSSVAPLSTPQSESNVTPAQKRKPGRRANSEKIDEILTTYKFMKVEDPGRQCAACGKVMASKSVLLVHIDTVHNGLVRVNGDDSPLTTSEEAQMLKDCMKRRGRLQCLIAECRKFYTTVLGYQYHTKICGVEVVKVTCEVCGALLRPGSMSYHMRGHSEQQPVVDPEPTDDLPRRGSKRKAALQAVANVQLYVSAMASEDRDSNSDTDQDFEFNQSHNYLKPGQITVPESVRLLWKESVAQGESLKCTHEGCSFEHPKSLSSVRFHYVKCPLRPVIQSYRCVKCDFTSTQEQDIIKHIDNLHPDEEFSGNESEDNYLDSLLEDDITTKKSDGGRNFDRSLPAQKAFDWVLEHMVDSSVDQVFPEWLPLRSAWSPLPHQQCEEFLPQTRESVQFRVVPDHANYKDCTGFSSLRLFSTHAASSERSSPVTMFVGGAVWGCAWCPTPASVTDQFLAVSCHTQPEDSHTKGQLTAGPGLIQLWKVSDIKPGDVSLCMSIAHAYGAIWNLRWCPDRCWQPPTETEQTFVPRLGLLAATFSDGYIRIYSVAQPASLERLNESSTVESPASLQRCDEGSAMYMPAPCAVLKATPEDPIAQNLTISWSHHDDITLLAAGNTEGHVIIWDLTTKSILLKTEINTFTTEILPCHKFKAHTSSVTGVDFNPHSDRHMATCGEDRRLKFWNLSDTRVPYSCTEKLGVMTSVAWPALWCGAFGAIENSYNFHAGRSLFHECGYFGYASQSFGLHRHSVWDVTCSTLVNSVASCDNAGTVMACVLPYKPGHNIKPDYYRRAIIYETEVEELTEQSNYADLPTGHPCDGVPSTITARYETETKAQQESVAAPVIQKNSCNVSCTEPPQNCKVSEQNVELTAISSTILNVATSTPASDEHLIFDVTPGSRDACSLTDNLQDDFVINPVRKQNNSNTTQNLENISESSEKPSDMTILENCSEQTTNSNNNSLQFQESTLDTNKRMQCNSDTTYSSDNVIVTEVGVTVLSDSKGCKRSRASGANKARTSPPVLLIPIDTYNQANNNLGLVFVDYKLDELTKKPHKPRGKSKQEVKNRFFNQELLMYKTPDSYPISSVNRIDWNPNLGKHTWIASCGNSGLVRLHNMKACEGSYRSNKHFNRSRL